MLEVDKNADNLHNMGRLTLGVYIHPCGGAAARKELTLVQPPRHRRGVYSYFDKGCPTKVKPYATMSKGVMGNRSSWSLI